MWLHKVSRVPSHRRAECVSTSPCISAITQCDPCPRMLAIRHRRDWHSHSPRFFSPTARPARIRVRAGRRHL
ncbi:hypothetical protein AURDEDRAFT_117543 [Auricularia subglabra TFB-10046 SS5]|nr:hypothetical protein AURDEDRAFT_117543 [Auricularia subglabra TFB-10046 SS5]